MARRTFGGVVDSLPETPAGPLPASLWTGIDYGSGDRPAIRDSSANHVDVRGSHVIVEQLQAYTTPGTVWTDPECEDQPVGWRTGFTIQRGADHVTIRNSLAYGNTAGVHVHRESRFGRVLHNELRDNVIMSRNTNDGGNVAMYAGETTAAFSAGGSVSVTAGDGTSTAADHQSARSCGHSSTDVCPARATPGR